MDGSPRSEGGRVSLHRDSVTRLRGSLGLVSLLFWVAQEEEEGEGVRDEERKGQVRWGEEGWRRRQKQGKK